MMKNLGVTEEEAKQIIADDKAIDRGEAMEFDLPEDKLKVANKYKNTGTRTVKKPFIPDLKTRPRKENGTKRGIIEDLFNALNESVGFSATSSPVISS